MGKEITLVKPSAHILASLQHCIHHHCNAGSLFSSATLVLPIHLFPGVTGRALKLGKGSGGLSLEAAGGWGREHISSTLGRARRGPGSAANFLQVKVRAGLWKRREEGFPETQPRTEVISQDGHPVLHLCHGRGPVTPLLQQPLCRDPPVPLFLHQLLRQGPLFCHQLTTLVPDAARAGLDVCFPRNCIPAQPSTTWYPGVGKAGSWELKEQKGGSCLPGGYKRHLLISGT